VNPQNCEPSSLRVLIVDQGPDVLETLSGSLSGAGFHVTCVRSGPEAVRLLLDAGADIVITSRDMPGMGGIDLCRTIRGEKTIPFVYILLLAAQAMDEGGVIEAFEAGADEVSQHPIGRDELLARLRPAGRLVMLQKELTRRQLDMHRYNAEIAHANRKLEESNWKLRHAATTDELTGLANRRAAFARLNEHWVSADRYKHGLACVAIDIDHFKAINDTYGHAAGDRVLREAAGVLASVTRRGETLCRIGGEEFLVLCPHAAAAEAAIGAERMRAGVENAPIKVGDREVRVTISLGVAERKADMTHPDDLLRAADDALYAAKAAGRNRVATAAVRPLPEPSAEMAGPA
jgi:diguanylate cyclase (GGDEF)-like protein